MIDAHCHLQDERLQNNLDAVITRARSAGVQRVVCCGVEESDWESVLQLNKRYPDFMTPSFGLHPWYVKNRSADWLKKLEGYLTQTPSGVGEVGLDFALTDYEETEQTDVFVQQLTLARKYQRPVSIHCRKAWEALVRIVKKEGPFASGGLVHSYSGAVDFIPSLCQANLSISFSGSITRSNNKRGHRALLAVSLERLLIETDSPDIPLAGDMGLNEPANLTRVAQAVANIRQVPLAQIIHITQENTKNIFC